jgi:hypothetical protein
MYLCGRLPRASVTEAFVAGFHPGGFFIHADPNLQPEVGHNAEPD